MFGELSGEPNREGRPANTRSEDRVICRRIPPSPKERGHGKGIPLSDPFIQKRLPWIYYVDIINTIILILIIKPLNMKLFMLVGVFILLFALSVNSLFAISFNPDGTFELPEREEDLTDIQPLSNSSLGFGSQIIQGVSVVPIKYKHFITFNNVGFNKSSYRPFSETLTRETILSKKSVTFPRGTTVYFFNASQRDLWLKTQDTTLEGFDQGGAAPSSREPVYQYTFSTPGEYVVYNALRPYQAITIIIDPRTVLPQPAARPPKGKYPSIPQAQENEPSQKTVIPQQDVLPQKDSTFLLKKPMQQKQQIIIEDIRTKKKIEKLDKKVLKKKMPKKQRKPKKSAAQKSPVSIKIR